MVFDHMKMATNGLRHLHHTFSLHVTLQDVPSLQAGANTRTWDNFLPCKQDTKKHLTTQAKSFGACHFSMLSCQEPERRYEVD